MADGGAGALERVEAYRIATSLIDDAWDDAASMLKHPLLKEPSTQLMRAVGSIAANIAEGYGRRSPRERIRFYEYALGSAEEARAWYQVGRRVLPDETMSLRGKGLTSVRRLLLTMIRNERTGGSWNASRRRDG